MNEVVARTRVAVDVSAETWWRLGVAALTAAAGAFFALRLSVWPPHEDETLALFTGRGSVHEMIRTVLGERGGAPLHFLFAWLIAHTGGGLLGLRAVSALFATASVPLVALLAARLADRAVALVAAAIVTPSWMLLFHGVYARMYSLFLFTATLSYIALLSALERSFPPHRGQPAVRRKGEPLGSPEPPSPWPREQAHAATRDRRGWMLWALAILASIATHPYGALVLASQGLYVLYARRLRSALPAFVAVALLAIPFWRSDRVLANRFDVGLGGRGTKLGGPGTIVDYLARVAGDLTAGWTVVRALVLLLALAGMIVLVRTRRSGAALTASVLVTPILFFLLTRIGSSTASPESRHLIFALPFFATLLALPLVRVARSHRLGPAVAVAVVVALGAVEIAWGVHKTRPLYAGEAQARVEARDAASSWLAEASRPTDVLFGYDPLFLGAWENNHAFSDLVVPRADTKLALRVLYRAPKPLGRGVWVLDASDTNNFSPKLTIPVRYPRPASAFEARVFGPFLVIRSRQPTRSIRRFLLETQAVQLVGQSLYLGDSDINLLTVERALGLRGLDAAGAR